MGFVTAVERRRMEQLIARSVKDEVGWVQPKIYKLLFPAKENAFFPGFCNPLFANFKFMRRQNFVDPFGRITIRKKQPDLLARFKSEHIVFNFNPARTFELEVGHNTLQAILVFNFKTQFAIVLLHA